LGITSVIQGQRLPKSVVDPKDPNHVPFKIQILDEGFSWPERIEVNVLVLNDEDAFAKQQEMCIDSQQRIVGELNDLGMMLLQDRSGGLNGNRRIAQISV